MLIQSTMQKHMIKVNSRLSRLLIGIKGIVLSVLRRGAQQKWAGKMELLGLHLARPRYVRLRLLMWWNYPNTNNTHFVSVEFVEMLGVLVQSNLSPLHQLAGVAPAGIGESSRYAQADGKERHDEHRTHKPAKHINRVKRAHVVHRAIQI